MKEKAKTEEELHRLKQEEDQQKKEQEKELQAQMEKEVRVTSNSVFLLKCCTYLIKTFGDIL